MASKAFVRPILRQVTSRGYAQAASAARSDPKISCAVLPNKVFVAALDNGAPLARVTVAFRAGARYEPQTELGISHVLRSAAGLTTKDASSFIIARKLAQLGASVSASGDREFVYYTLEATHENLQPALELLNNIVSNQEFRPWELDDNVSRLKYDIAALSPQVRAVDLLHKAAYRRGLGNSLFISPKRIGKISSESLQHFASSYVALGHCAVSVVGDSLDKANTVGQLLKLTQGSSNMGEPAKYYGGDSRKEMGGDFAHVAIAVQGAPAGTPQSLALAIAAKALGCGPVTKWGGDNSVLAKAIGNIGPFAAAGFNVSYSDSGLFGVVLTVPKDEANKAVKAAAAFLKKPALDERVITAGKNQLKLQVLSEADDGSSLSEMLAAQGLHYGKVSPPSDIARAIDSVSNSDVAGVLSRAGASKISMGCAGNLAFVPYSDEL